MKRIIILTALSMLTACSHISTPSHNTFSSIEETKVSCYDFPFPKDPAPTDPNKLTKLTKIQAKFECQWFTYNVDGHSVRGVYLYSKTADTTKRPVIIVNRGGNALSGVVPFKFIVSQFLPLANAGYVVIASQYRGAREGNKPPEDYLADEFGGKDVNDVLALLPIIDSMPQADSNRIGMLGGSRGAMMGYLAATHTNRIRALVTIGGPTDLLKEIPHRPVMEDNVLSRWIPNYYQNREAELIHRSAQKWPEKLPKHMAVLLMHGEQDDKVQPENSINMAEKLKQEGIPHKLMLFPNAGHSIKNKENKKEFHQAILQWFDQHVKNGSN